MGRDRARPSSDLFQAALIELDQIEICPDIFPASAAAFLEEMGEARFLRDRVGPTGNHRLVPLLDRFRRMLRAICRNPIQNGSVIIEPMRGFLERIGIPLQKGEEMFVEADGFVIVAVEQSFAMQLRFIDQARQMHVTAESIIRTAWQQLLHSARARSRAKDVAPLLVR